MGKILPFKRPKRKRTIAARIVTAVILRVAFLLAILMFSLMVF